MLFLQLTSSVILAETTDDCTLSCNTHQLDGMVLHGKLKCLVSRALVNEDALQALYAGSAPMLCLDAVAAAADNANQTMLPVQRSLQEVTEA